MKLISHENRKVAAGLGAILTLSLLAGCKPTTATAASSSEPKPTTATVAKQDLIGYGFFEGKVIAPPGSQASVTSSFDVAISEVLTSVGKRVGRGETIIKMNMPDVQSSLAIAQGNLKAAETAYAAAKASNDTPVREAAKMLADARAAEKQARLDIQNGLPADLEAATQSRKAAEEALAVATANRNSMVVSEKQAVDLAAEYLKEIRSGAKVANIKAPISGTIISLEAKPGLVVKPNQQLATIIDLAAIRIQGVAPAALKDLAVKGKKVLIALNGTDSTPFDGTIKDVTVMPPDQGQEGPGYTVVIDFDNSKGLVRPGTEIKRLGIETGEARDALVVPVDAVKTDKDGKSTVMVQSGSEWVATPVEIGLSDGVMTEIKSGLKEGDVVKLVG